MKMKTNNYQNDIPTIIVDNLTGRYLLVFDLTSLQGATETCQYPELV